MRERRLNSKLIGRQPQSWEVEGSAGSSLAFVARAEKGERGGSSLPPSVPAVGFRLAGGRGNHKRASGIGPSFSTHLLSSLPPALGDQLLLLSFTSVEYLFMSHSTPSPPPPPINQQPNACGGKPLPQPPDPWPLEPEAGLMPLPLILMG